MSTEEPPELGITEADRERMGEIAANRKAASPGGSGLPHDAHPVVKAVRVEVAWLGAVEDVEYFRAYRIADELPYTAHQVGQALRTLVDEGLVERDGETGSGVRWRITL